MATPDWKTRVKRLDLPKDVMGTAIDFIMRMPEEDREIFVDSDPEIAKATILSRVRGPLDKVVSAADILLRYAPPKCIYPMALKLSGTISVHSAVPQPQNLKKWRGFQQEVSVWATSALPRVEGQSAILVSEVAGRRLYGGYLVRDEVAIYGYWDFVLWEPLSGLIQRGLFIKQPSLDKGNLPKAGRADRALCYPSGTVILPIEIKHRYALRPGKSPFTDYPSGQNQEKSAADKHVEQVYGHLIRNKDLKYAILCSDEDYYFLKLENQTLFYSDSIGREQLQPSVISAVCYLIHLALEHSGTAASPEPASTPAGGAPGAGAAGVVLQAVGWFWRLAAGASACLHLLWLQLKGPSAPGIIDARSLQLAQQLGSGITGTVFLGTLWTGLKVAVKVPSREGRRQQGEAQQLQELRNEVAVLQALGRLQRSVVPALVVHGTLVTEAGDQLPFLATEFLEGSVPLSAIASGGLSSAQAADARAALAAMHALGVAHCDIRGDNLMLMPDGTIRLLDFGHAQLAAGPEYMARDARDLDVLLTDLLHPQAQPVGQLAVAGQVGTLPAAAGGSRSELAGGTARGRPAGTVAATSMASRHSMLSAALSSAAMPPPAERCLLRYSHSARFCTRPQGRQPMHARHAPRLGCFYV